MIICPQCMHDLAKHASALGSPMRHIPPPGEFRTAHHIGLIEFTGGQTIIIQITCTHCYTIVEVQQTAMLRADGVWEITKVMQ